MPPPPPSAPFPARSPSPHVGAVWDFPSKGRPCRLGQDSSQLRQDTSESIQPLQLARTALLPSLPASPRRRGSRFSRKTPISQAPAEPIKTTLHFQAQQSGVEGPGCGGKSCLPLVAPVAFCSAAAPGVLCKAVLGPGQDRARQLPPVQDLQSMQQRLEGI